MAARVQRMWRVRGCHPLDCLCSLAVDHFREDGGRWGASWGHILPITIVRGGKLWCTTCYSTPRILLKTCMLAAGGDRGWGSIEKVMDVVVSLFKIAYYGGKGGSTFLA